MPHNESALTTVRSFQSAVDAMREEPEPVRARLTIWALAGFVTLALGIGLTAKVDMLVQSSSGKIVAPDNSFVFQSLDPAIIKTIDVKEGQQVEKGQLLATLDPTFAAADVGQLRDQIASLDAQIARDQAELSGKDPVYQPSLETGGSAHFDQYAALQDSLYVQQKKQFSAQIVSFDAKIKLTNATIDKLQQDISRYKQREDISKQVQSMRQRLEADGAGSKLNLLAATDADLEMLRTLEFDQNSLTESQHQLASAQADRDAFVQQWRATAGQDLVTSRNTRDAAVEQLKNASRHLDLVRLTAPRPSVVLSIAKLSAGSVLKQGDELMRLVPQGASTEAEIHVLARDVGYVSPGDACTLKIDSFNYTEYGTADCSVEWISDDAFTSDDERRPVAPYYKIRAKIGAMHFKSLPANFRLIPGMTLEADLQVGKRSVAAYLFDDILHRASNAMREPQ